ncbi:MAG TPA: J domain-containing protein [Polyangiaceae bacterium]|nr:J domain-containing protein [Polyangiaceae bacterium]
MNLPGLLRLTTLGDVLGAVYREGATGVVELREVSGARAGHTHRIHLQGGLVVEVETDVPTARVGEVLRRRGIVTEADVARAVSRMPLFPDRRFGELLVAMHAARESDVAFALRLQRRERLERLFLLSDARIVFRVARTHGAPSAPLPTDEVLHGRARFRDRDGRANGAEPREIHASRRDPARGRALAALGLGDGADLETVQRAFRKLAASMHPDRFPTADADERATLMRRFAEITAAYHSLVA